MLPDLCSLFAGPARRRANGFVAPIKLLRLLVAYGSGYYRRYLPKFVYVKSVLDSGTIGRVTSVNLRLSQSRHKFEGEEVRADWRVDATNAGGGLFMDLGYVAPPKQSLRHMHSDVSGLNCVDSCAWNITFLGGVWYARPALDESIPLVVPLALPVVLDL